ncbi:sigma-54 dependent transcriptional regulator [Vibrio sp. SCSIO 43136]|uniref:sigma-54-dependent transcriptional regulator n=1 Tax=Vibrio sp. SCSIO 43136 TaxID=2819101 RepID=UPI0020751105|nr:sigma-54 dependent transcriptional regulator [Vibrio sp. SCSIO 43136]USD64886.1 sigma-54-dependent Fis family transcriptional regulator [Vibrio sp. SCSIO 43136]
MGSQFRMDSIPGSLVLVGGIHEPWLKVLEQVGWRCQRCDDLREAQTLFTEVGPCIGVVDLSQDEFSLNGLANLVSSHKHVRWIAFVRESQLASDTICQFIVNFCIDFFTAPIPDAQLLSTIGHQSGMLKLEKKVWPHYGDNGDLGLIGDSMTVKRLRDQVKRVGPTDVSILIFGESGAGKEKVARAVHNSSSRSKKPFIAVNCSAMSETRLEREVFGLDYTQPCVLEQADGGTVLFNDILSMSASSQQRLLDYLQEGTVESANNSVANVDVRILVSNHSDMEKALLDGDFNQELYHRLNVLRVNVPSLKDRPSDIPFLANYYLNIYSQEYNAQAKSYSEAAMKALCQYHWPGNLRELSNQIKRVVLLSDSVVIDECHLDLPKRMENKRSLRAIRERSEKEAILMVLESYEGQVTLAAKELGVSRATMYRLLNKHNLISEAGEV